jgi:hypothetical protein
MSSKKHDSTAGTSASADTAKAAAPEQAPPEQTSTAPPADESQDGGQISLVKKIVAKDIVGRTELKMKEDSEPKALYTVFGVVRDTASGESNYGSWLSFLGSFEAIRLKDRARFQSDKLFLQNPAEGMLLQQFSNMRKEDPAATLGFAFEIGVKVSERWKETGQGNSYEYTVKTVFQTKQHDPLAQLRASVVPRLPPPAPVPAAS